MLTVREHNHISSLTGLRNAWAELLRETPAATFFQTRDWLEIYWRHFGAGQRLRLLVVERDAQPIGILPLVVRRERTRLGSLSFLTYPLDYWGSFFGPIGPAPAETLQAGLRHIRSTRRDWDVLDLRWIEHDSPAEQAVQSAWDANELRRCPTPLDTSFVLDLQGTWPDYLAARTSKWRNNRNRCERRLAELGEVRFQRWRPAGELLGDGDPRWDLYDACEELAARSWQGSSSTGTTLSSPRVRDFLRDIHAAAARCGSVDLNLLWLNGQLAAFAYNYVQAGSVFGLRAGYDERLTNDGAGCVLLWRAIEDSFARGDWRYDLGVGSPESKRIHSPRPTIVLRYSHFAATSPAAQLLGFHRRRQSRAWTRSLTDSTRSSVAESR